MFYYANDPQSIIILIEVVKVIIYKITNKTNDKIYIGQTTRDIEERLKEHKRSKNSLVGKAIKKHGESNFIITVIDQAETIEELNEKEFIWVNHYNCIVPNGYNQCEGGGNTFGFNHREESRKKMSLNKKGKYTEEDNHFFGKKHSDETREKMREAWKTKRTMTEEMKRKLREAHPTKKVINLDTNEVFNSIKEAANKYNLKETHISRVCRGKRKTTGGFRWEYK